MQKQDWFTGCRISPRTMALSMISYLCLHCLGHIFYNLKTVIAISNITNFKYHKTQKIATESSKKNP